MEHNGSNGDFVDVPVPPQPAAPVREQDRLLPSTKVKSIMRRALPPQAKISEDASASIQECVSEFISFITGEANERCRDEHRKTITADDIVGAMERLGFDKYIMPLRLYIQRMREYQCGGRGNHVMPRMPLQQAQIHDMQAHMQHDVYAPPAAAQAYTLSHACAGEAPPTYSIDLHQALYAPQSVANAYPISMPVSTTNAPYNCSTNMPAPSDFGAPQPYSVAAPFSTNTSDAYSFARPTIDNSSRTHVIDGQYEMVNGSSLVPYYGGWPYGASSLGLGDSAGEASSSNTAPAPATGTSFQ